MNKVSVWDRGLRPLTRHYTQRRGGILMSIWTQINGSITIRDLFQELGWGRKINKAMLEEILGKTCSFESGDDEWDACTVPCGSEGSLQYFIHKVDSTYVAWIISIIGSLRDYENVNEIKQWFKKTLSTGLCFREATLQVYVEGKEKVVFSLRDNKETEMLERAQKTKSD